PTPRGGGIGILAGFAAGSLAAWMAGMQLPTTELFIALFVIALVGFIDDSSGGLPVSIRLALHIVAAGIVVYRADGLAELPLPQPLNVSLGVLGVPAALVWMVGVTNLYNFLDGIDGFAGLQGAVAGLALSFFSGADVFLSVGLALSASCAGFLFHNWHPARVFMGDVGSGTLGFALAALPFQLGPARRGEGVFLVAMCLWFFLSDGLFTILLRLSRGEKIWEAHRSHLYQRLVKTGLPHDYVTLRVGLAAAMIAAIAVASIQLQDAASKWASLAVALASFLAYLHWTKNVESRSLRH
ncbi:MAG TPA: glycosyltransferase family 4 protein, partial [Blastocatellia bacterium]|nr:glycosyltransferase family 4 protein [Blastocatellia bacterium]